jgi:predicted butyrate kinase (DUF1464 family)
MAAAAEVVVCTTGPYSSYGTPVVRVRTQAHANLCYRALHAQLSFHVIMRAKVLGRTFVMVQLCHSNDFGSL